jgi:mycothiol synthase
MLCQQRIEQLFLGPVRFLSNLFSKGGQAGDPILTGKIPPDRLSDALSLMLAGPGQKAQMAQMVVFMQSAKARGMDLSQIRVAMRGGQMLYAALPSILPGKSLLLIAGTPANPQSADAARLLLGQIVEEYQSADLCMMQTLVEPHDVELINLFQSCGFTRLAELVYLETQPRALNWKLPDDTWELVSYSPELHGAFAQAILESYQGTLDCPGLNGVRGVEDIIEGHKGSGKFEPEHWLLLRQSGRPAGVLLLARTPASDALDLVYIGLSPWARGKGLASELMKLAVSRALELSCGRLTTAVDAQNTPAIQMYYRVGMQRIGSRLALMRVIHRRG